MEICRIASKDEEVYRSRHVQNSEEMYRKREAIEQYWLFERPDI